MESSIIDDKDRIAVLDHGYVRLTDTLGDDLSVVNAARVSYDKESREMTEGDTRLIRYLVRNEHTSPLRHAMLTFEVYAPLMVARQWWKHAIGGAHGEHVYDPAVAWNESSRRYVTEEPEFYVPSQFLSAPENKKQGSGEAMSSAANNVYSMYMRKQVLKGMELYNRAMDDGMAPEQARLFLPAYAMYVRWRWTTSLHAALHFVDLRADSHAQYEIQQYAKAVSAFVNNEFPVTAEEWDNRND